MKKSMLAAICALSVGAVLAEDQGPAVAVSCQENNSATTSPVGEGFISAGDKVRADLEKLGVSEGYDPDKQTIVVVGESWLKVPNPAGDDSFMTKRSLKAMEAYLNAKAEIIRAFSMEFSAEEQVATAAEFGESAAQVEVANKTNEFKNKLNVSAAKLAPIDAELAGKLTDAAIDDNLSANLDAAIAKSKAAATPPPGSPETPPPESPETPPPESPETPPPAPEGDLAAEFASLKTELAGIKESTAALNLEPVNEATSSVKLMSKMPLLGSTVLCQAESWDKTEQTYSIAMAVLWSPKLQEAAKQLASGTPVAAEKKGKLSAQEWIRKQDIMAMVGPRRFTDKNGNTVIIGISARDLSGIPVSKTKGAKMLADTDAMKAVATSLMCDLLASREAKSALQEFGDDTSKATESIVDKIGSKTDLQLSGVMRLSQKEGPHPISGRKTYAVAYYMDPVLCKDAMEKIKQLYADAITVQNATQYRRGQLAGMEGAYQEAKDSTEKFEAGKAEGKADVQGRVRAEEVKAKVEGAEGSSGKGTATGRGGVVSGDDLDLIEID